MSRQVSRSNYEENQFNFRSQAVPKRANTLASNVLKTQSNLGSYSQKIVYDQRYSAIDNNLLQQIRREHEILKKIDVNDHDLKAEEEEKLDETVSKHQRQREYDFLLEEKKSLQVIVSNCMIKIEELLEKERQYKREISELQFLIDGKGGINAAHEKAMKKWRKKEDELLRKIRVLEQQLERANVTIPELEQKNRKLESLLSLSEKKLRAETDWKLRLEQELKEEKDRSQELDYKLKEKIVEFQLVERGKNSEILGLKAELDDMRTFVSGDSRTKLDGYEATIKQKTLMYEDLQEEFRLYKIKVSQEGQSQSKEQSITKVIELLKERRKETGPEQVLMESMHAIIDKMENSKRSENQYNNQLLTLRKEIQSLKGKADLTNSERIKIEELERELRYEAETKNKYYNQLVETKKELHELEKHNQLLTSQVLQLSKSPQEPQVDAAHLQKIQVLTKTITEKQTIIRNMQQQHNQQHFIQKIQQLEILADRRLKEGKFEAEMARKEVQHELQHLKAENARLSGMVDALRNQLNTLKRENTDLMIANDQNLHSKVTEWRQKQSLFIKRIEELQKVGKLDGERRDGELEFLRRELHQWRIYRERARRITESTDILWKEKEEEYQKLNYLLDNMKATERAAHLHQHRGFV